MRIGRGQAGRMFRGQRISAAGLCCLLLASACTGDDSAESVPQPSASAGEPAAPPCGELKSDSGPIEVTRSAGSIPHSKALRTSRSPRRFAAAAITSNATPLLDDPPGRMRMIAFWGEPGAHEPTEDTPVTFLSVDGRWRQLTRRDLGDRMDYLSAGQDTLSPDGSRWVVDSGGWNVMFDFRTAESVKLTPGAFTKSASWSPGSQAVALWTITEPGIEIFDRTGRRLAMLSIDVRKRLVFMPNDHRVTIFEPAVDRSAPRIRFTTYDLKGMVVETTYCALPSGYPPRATGVDGYDGRRLWISALVDSKRWVYRYSVVDTSTGVVIHDIVHTGAVPWFEQWVRPGLYVSGIVGAPVGLYAVDPKTGVMARFSVLDMYVQEGYENHAHSQFARDLVFGGGATSVRE